MKKAFIVLSLMLLMACGNGGSDPLPAGAVYDAHKYNNSVPVEEASYLVLTVDAPGAAGVQFVINGVSTKSHGLLPESELYSAAKMTASNSGYGFVNVAAIDFDGMDKMQFVLYGNKIGNVSLSDIKIGNIMAELIDGKITISDHLKPL